MSVHADKTLYLHAEEQKIFERLPEELKKGWRTRTEELSYNDSLAKRHVRASFLRFKTPALRKLQVHPPTLRTEQDLWKFFDAAGDLPLHTDDIVNLCFTMGPAFMDRLIPLLLQGVSTPSDMEITAYFAKLRHAILSSLCTYA